MPPTAGVAPEIVLTAADVRVIRGNWKKEVSKGSPGNRALVSADRRRSWMNAPRPAPADYFEATFRPVADVPYRVWLRLRGRRTNGDSVWVQFTGAVTESGAPLWRVGTKAGLLVLQSPCRGCPPSGWGWEDNGWWLDSPSIVRFTSSAPQTVRVQTREDGVRVDHIVLSPSKYLTSAPGAVSNDRTVLARKRTSLRPEDVVLRVEDAVRRAGRWSVVADGTAAGGRRFQSANRGWSSTTRPLPRPKDAVEFTFTAIAGVRYRVWMRVAADADSRANDSVWLQFDNVLDERKRPVHRLGARDGLLVNRQQCPSCAISGWGWSGGAWWRRAGFITFRTTGSHRLRVQPREDGVRFDQIVISPREFLRDAPGQRENDGTIVER